MSADVVVHLAGPDVRSSTRLRQLCAWCGARLLDVDLPPPPEPMLLELGLGQLVPSGAVIESADIGRVIVKLPTPPPDGDVRTWEPFALVAVQPGMPPWALERDGTIPEGACILAET